MYCVIRIQSSINRCLYLSWKFSNAIKTYFLQSDAGRLYIKSPKLKIGEHSRVHFCLPCTQSYQIASPLWLNQSNYQKMQAAGRSYLKMRSQRHERCAKGGGWKTLTSGKNARGSNSAGGDLAKDIKKYADKIGEQKSSYFATKIAFI